MSSFIMPLHRCTVLRWRERLGNEKELGFTPHVMHLQRTNSPELSVIDHCASSSCYFHMCMIYYDGVMRLTQRQIFESVG